MNETLTILIADDHPLFRKGLRTLLSTIPQVSLAGEASTGAEAIAAAAELQPDVVLMDLQMPGGGGLNAIREIVRTSPHIRVLVCTMFEDDDSVFAAMRAGARGYVLKDMDDEQFVRAIMAVGNGEAIFSPAIAARMVDLLRCAAVRTRRRLPRADGERAKCPAIDGSRREERRNRTTARSQPEDGAQLYQQHLQQTTGGRPRARRSFAPGRRDGEG